MDKETNSALNLPFAEVEVLALKNAIVEKFGSVAKFCRLAKRNLQDTNVALRKKTAGNTELLKSIFKDAKRLQNVSVPGYNFTEAHKKKIKDALGQFDTLTAFCQDNPQFSIDFVSRVTNKGLHRITKKARALASVLAVDLNK